MIVERITGIDRFPTEGEHSISNQNWVEAPGVHATFSIRHDNSSIYLCYLVEEPQVRAVNTEFNSPVWEDSCVEFFLSLGGDDGYYNFEINAIGTVLGAFGIDRNKRFHLADSLLTLIETTPSLEHKPIENLEQKTSWRMQLIIPVRVLHFSNIKNLSGVDAQANFYKCGDKLKHPHYLSWKPVRTTKPDFHSPKYFGQLYFI
jgi:hypothetical protein